MSESQFTTLVVVAFVLVVIGVTVSFTYFVRWFKRDRTIRPPPEALLRHQAEMDDNFRANHPDAEDEESSGSSASPDEPTGSCLCKPSCTGAYGRKKSAIQSKVSRSFIRKVGNLDK